MTFEEHDARKVLAIVEASRTAWLATADALTDPIYVVDPSFTLIRVNRALAEATGNTPKNLVGKKCHEVLFGSPTPCALCLARSAFNGQAPIDDPPREVEGYLQGKTVEARAVPLPAEGAAMVTLHDVTQHKAMVRQLLETEKLASLGQLAAGMAHEINNPLASAVANIEVALESLKARGENPDSVDALADARASLERVRRIVRDLARYAERETSPNEVSLGPLLHVNALIARDESTRSDVELGLLASELPRVRADPEKLAIALRSVLRNAIEASPTKGRVEIAVSVRGTLARIVVTDQGPGIPPENRRRVFDPFFTTKRPGPHMGLGLSLAYSLVHGMKGDIDVRCPPEKGCSFVISVPLAAEDAPRSL